MPDGAPQTQADCLIALSMISEVRRTLAELVCEGRFEFVPLLASTALAATRLDRQILATAFLGGQWAAAESNFTEVN